MLYWLYYGLQIGIIGGSGLDNPDILKNRSEKIVTTPYGSPSDALIVGDIEGVPVVLLARHGRQHNIMPGIYIAFNLLKNSLIFAVIIILRKS